MGIMSFNKALDPNLASNTKHCPAMIQQVPVPAFHYRPNKQHIDHSPSSRCPHGSGRPGWRRWWSRSSLGSTSRDSMLRSWYCRDLTMSAPRAFSRWPAMHGGGLVEQSWYKDHCCMENSLRAVSSKWRPRWSDQGRIHVGGRLGPL